MLGKLLKYDLKWIYKVVVIFYILGAIFSVIGRIFNEIDNSLVCSVISKISYGIAISMMINSLINCILRLWARFISNIYKDESYLTHTLPISKNEIYNSKVLSAIISIFTTIVVTLICLFICYYSKENIQVLKKLLELAATTYDTTVIKLVLLISIIFLIEIIYAVLIGYVGIILGHKTNKNRILMSIIIGFALYMITQIISLIFIVICGLVSPNIMNLINTTAAIDIDAIKSIMYLGIVAYTIYTIFFYFIGNKKLGEGVNVE